MCGIAGWCRNTDVPLTEDQLGSLRIITALLLDEISIRGFDSTGLGLFGREDKSVIIKKECIPAWEFTQNDAVIKLIKDKVTANTWCCTEHARAGTHGINIKSNAHPFNFATLVGTHNGVIRNYEQLEKSYKAKPTGDTDSEVLFASMAELLKEEDNLDDRLLAIATVLEDAYGSAALAMVDKKLQRVYLYKHSNPLALFYDSNMQALFWASTMPMVSALRRAGLSGETLIGEHLPPNTLFSFNPSDFIERLAIAEASLPIVQKILPTVKTVQTPLAALQHKRSKQDICALCKRKMPQTYKRLYNLKVSRCVCTKCYHKHYTVFANLGIDSVDVTIRG